MVSSVASLLAWAALKAAYEWARVESPALMERVTGIPRAAYSDMWGVDYTPFVGPFTFGILIICLIPWLVGLAARGGLITAVDDVEGQDVPGSAFGTALRRGPRLALMTIVLFFPVILLNFLGRATLPNWPVLANPFAVSPLAESFPASINFYLMGFGLHSVTLIPMLFLQLIYPFAFRGMVLRDLTIFGTIRHGWGVLRGNLTEIVPLALLFCGVHIVLWGIANAVFIALSAYLIYKVTGSPDAVNAFLRLDFDVVSYHLVFNFVSQPDTLDLFAMVGRNITLALLLASVAIGTIMTAWRSAAFTIGYRRWTDDESDNRER